MPTPEAWAGPVLPLRTDGHFKLEGGKSLQKRKKLTSGLRSPLTDALWGLPEPSAGDACRCGSQVRGWCHGSPGEPPHPLGGNHTLPAVGGSRSAKAQSRRGRPRPWQSPIGRQFLAIGSPGVHFLVPSYLCLQNFIAKSKIR